MSFTEEELEKIANQLDEMQKARNEGRGISCLRTVVNYLRWKEPHHAIAVCWNEGDKISSYPDIVKFLQGTLMKGQNWLTCSFPTDA